MSRRFLGRYEEVKRLGEGGMGRVYLARDYNLARQVVVKVLHPQIAADPAFRERFEAEARITAQFEHPHAVRVYDFGTDPLEGPCIIMEFVRGMTLAELLKKNRGRLSAARFYRLLGQLCEVLQAAHEQGLIHRDLKPANLMVLEPDSPTEKIKVMDFGLAQLRSAPDADARNAASSMGTPYYMSPEQARGLEVDHRSDLYSVGVILFEVLTGKLPFTGATVMDVLAAHVEKEPPGFGELGDIGTIPWAVEDVVDACLAKDPDQRPKSAQELIEMYKKALFEDRLPPMAFKKAPEKEEAPAPKENEQIKIDPNAIVYHMEASMNRSVAEFKLKGFVRDAGGSLVETVPGLIRVQLGYPGSRYEMAMGKLSWLGMGRDAGMVEVYLYLRQKNPRRPDLQNITVIMLSLKGHTPENAAWLAQCSRIYSDLRGYLMGHDVK